MTEINRDKPICVTGASGYIAGWLVKDLLEQGLVVHATVRNPSNKASVGHLEQIASETKGVLKLFAADLLTPGSFDKAVDGCELVIHTASPFVIKGFEDAQIALVDPAVKGTENLLNSCNKSASVKRVVLTSSVASVFGDNVENVAKNGRPFDESDWNVTSSVDHQPYSFSKVMAERKAWEMCKAQDRWDLVTVNPSLVMGPSLTKQSQSTSIDVMRDLGSGRQATGVPHLEFGLVDVRDVAKAHVLAGFTPAAQGRFIVSAETGSLLSMARMLKKHFPKYPLPKAVLPKFLVWLVGPIAAGVSRKYVKLNVGYPVGFDNSRSKNVLGLKYRPLESTLREHFQQMIEDGLLKSR